MRRHHKRSLPRKRTTQHAAFEKRWQVFVAAANLWPKLDESEAKIDRLINNALRRVIPRVEEPITFKDWRDDLKLWDFQTGLSAATLNERWDVVHSRRRRTRLPAQFRSCHPIGIHPLARRGRLSCVPYGL